MLRRKAGTWQGTEQEFIIKYFHIAWYYEVYFGIVDTVQIVVVGNTDGR
jgi:hypothetical protein